MNAKNKKIKKILARKMKIVYNPFQKLYKKLFARFIFLNFLYFFPITNFFFLIHLF